MLRRVWSPGRACKYDNIQYASKRASLAKCETTYNFLKHLAFTYKALNALAPQYMPVLISYIVQ